VLAVLGKIRKLEVPDGLQQLDCLLRVVTGWVDLETGRLLHLCVLVVMNDEPFRTDLSIPFLEVSMFPNRLMLHVNLLAASVVEEEAPSEGLEVAHSMEINN